MITFNNTGISTEPTKSGRTLVYTDVIYNGEVYKWALYVSNLKGNGLTEYLEAHEKEIEADIEAKEQVWGTVPHTEEVIDEFTGKIKIVQIPKDRYVKPDVPDEIELKSGTREQLTEIKQVLVSVAPEKTPISWNVTKIVTK